MPHLREINLALRKSIAGKYEVEMKCNAPRFYSGRIELVGYGSIFGGFCAEHFARHRVHFDIGIVGELDAVN